MELAIVNNEMAMDSRDIAKLTKKRHANVCRDIREIIKTNQDRLSFESGYLDKNRQERVCYKLPYRETILLLTGYSVDLRAAVIDRWLYLEKRYKKAKQEAIDTRNNFTGLLKDHGYDKPHQYIQTTTQMKNSLSINKPKKEMTERELRKIRAAEALADMLIENEHGYNEVNPVCLEGCEIVNKALFSKTLKRLESIGMQT